MTINTILPTATIALSLSFLVQPTKAASVSRVFNRAAKTATPIWYSLLDTMPPDSLCRKWLNRIELSHASKGSASLRKIPIKVRQAVILLIKLSKTLLTADERRHLNVDIDENIDELSFQQLNTVGAIIAIRRATNRLNFWTRFVELGLFPRPNQFTNVLNSNLIDVVEKSREIKKLLQNPQIQQELQEFSRNPHTIPNPCPDVIYLENEHELTWEDIFNIAIRNANYELMTKILPKVLLLTAKTGVLRLYMEGQRRIAVELLKTIGRNQTDLNFWVGWSDGSQFYSYDLISTIQELISKNQLPTAALHLALVAICLKANNIDKIRPILFQILRSNGETAIDDLDCIRKLIAMKQLNEYEIRKLLYQFGKSTVSYSFFMKFHSYRNANLVNDLYISHEWSNEIIVGLWADHYGLCRAGTFKRRLYNKDPADLALEIISLPKLKREDLRFEDIDDRVVFEILKYGVIDAPEFLRRVNRILSLGVGEKNLYRTRSRRWDEAQELMVFAPTPEIFQNLASFAKTTGNRTLMNRLDGIAILCNHIQKTENHKLMVERSKRIATIVAAGILLSTMLNRLLTP